MLKKIISMMMAVILTFGIFAFPVLAEEPVTWNYSNIGDPTFENNNLTAYFNVDMHSITCATEGVTEGKWYWENKILYESGEYACIGIVDDTFKRALALYTTSGLVGVIGIPSIETSTFATTGDIIGIALDMDNKTIQLYKNGNKFSEQYNFSHTQNSSKLYPYVGVNYGSTLGVTTNFGATPFEYSIPDGYEPYDQSGNDSQQPSLLSLLLAVDEEIQLSITSNLEENSNFDWSSDDTSIAVVDSNGTITAIEEGVTKITARNADGFEEYINVRILPQDQIEDLRLAVDLVVGSSARLYLSDSEDITWTSLSPDIVQIDSTGKITAISDGLALIQAELDGTTYHIYVRVRN